MFYTALLQNRVRIFQVFIFVKTSFHFLTSNTSISVHSIRVWMVEDLDQLFLLNPKPKVKSNEINPDFHLLRREMYSY